MQTVSADVHQALKTVSPADGLSLSASRKTCGLGSSQDFHISRQQQQLALASNLLQSSSTIQLAHHPQAKPMDPITRPVASSSFHRSAAKHLHRAVTSAQRNGVSRRCLLTLLTSTAAIPPGGSESRKALLQGEREIDQTFSGSEKLILTVHLLADLPLHIYKLMQLVRSCVYRVSEEIRGEQREE